MTVLDSYFIVYFDGITALEVLYRLRAVLYYTLHRCIRYSYIHEVDISILVLMEVQQYSIHRDALEMCNIIRILWDYYICTYSQL